MSTTSITPMNTWAQQPCDSTRVKELEKEFRKVIKGGRQDKGQYTRTHGGATIAFQIAQCYVNVNDSLYRHWLEMALHREKIGYPHGYEVEPRNAAIRDVGLYYYLLGDMPQAEIWAAAYLIAAPHEPLAHYRHGLALLGLRRYAESMAAFTKAQELGGDMPDLGELIERCRAGLHTTH
jgi:tetratricopeptide (TPR) repeat protein